MSNNKSTLRPCPSPSGRNDENLFLKTTLVRGSAPLATDSALVEALKSKFRTAADACRAMDIDPALLELPSRGGKFDPRDHTGGEIEGGVERRGEDRHGRRVRDEIEPKWEEMPPQRMSVAESEHAEDEEDDERLEPFREYLRNRHGMSEDEIDEAAAEFAKDVRRRRANGRDRRHADDRRRAKDFMPHNRVRGSEREPPSGGRFGGERRSGYMPTGRDKFEIPPNSNAEGHEDGLYLKDHGLDRARSRFAHDRSLAEVRQVRKLLTRFGPGEAGCRPDRRRDYQGAADSARGASERQRQRFFQMFPNVERIGDPSHDGKRDWSRRGPYEV